MYRVQLSSEAENFYAAVNLPLAKKLARCFERLEEDPRNHPNIKALKGNFAGYYRYRVGDYRVVYYIEQNVASDIEEEEGRVIVILIAHRSEVYE
ncbi:type II toxin-antitoxin system RelE/ParE family toxin [Aerosakkonemataceae cyanobacterium BLCC-F50]|uniref:Type II toxin-antitoxin system RelE/ParE family toxin n=1 Tax=Floridaenema flaviceps BLCC-F50 TaxID=3153642 RepID=A0ABV4XIB5_9CYAN